MRLEVGDGGRRRRCGGCRPAARGRPRPRCGRKTATTASPGARLGAHGDGPCDLAVPSAVRDVRRPRQAPAQHVEPGEPGGEGAARAGPAPRRWGPPRRPRPASSTTTRSASSSASRTSWVTSTAVRSASTRRSIWRSAGRHRDVEGGHRLVEQQQPRLGGQRPGHRDPLGLAAGELRRPAVAPGRRRRPRRASRPPPRAPATAGPRAARAERDVLQDGEVREQQRLLREQRDPRWCGAARRRRRAPRRRRRAAPARRARPGPRSGRSRPAVDREHRRLAGAVGPEQRRRSRRRATVERDLDVAVADHRAT